MSSPENGGSRADPAGHDQHDPIDDLESVGPYRIRERLGEGGMGAVYVAEQKEPVKRHVALKIIKPGMDSRDVVARFEAERQALALMDHPCIAKVYDGGATAEGRPYFAMELVRGVRITEYCDMNKLDIRERLRVFVQACDAVQHAHQKGVVHRDLKPSNILVVDHDGKPMPKVIDFGIAKAMGQRLTDKSLHTQRGVLLGTPAYMSPEQAESSGLDVDTRTDIYSLGVILYEMLAGKLPFEDKDLQGFAAVVTLRETEPPTPSDRFRKLGERGKRIAELRDTDPGELGKRLKGDLDWIVMKAMEKDRNRRYETANGLRLEIERYLNDEPVLARAPSATYRMGKFVRRHRAGVVAAGIATLALVASSVLATAGMVRARRAEARALQEAATAEQVSDFLVGLFEGVDPYLTPGREPTARALLDQGAERIETELGGQPVVQARMMKTMGRAYRGLGLYESSTPLLQGSLEKLIELHGDENGEAARAKVDLAYLFIHKGEYDRAEELTREALATFRRLDDDREIAGTINNLVFGFLRARENYDEGEALLREALELQRGLHGEEHLDLAMTMDHLCWILMRKGETDEAAPYCTGSLEMRKKLYGGDHPEIGYSLARFGWVQERRGQFEEALATYEEMLALNQRLYGEAHPEIAYSLMNQARMHQTLGRPGKGIQLARQAAALQREMLGEDNPEYATALMDLGGMEYSAGNVADAYTHLTEALAIRRRTSGENHPSILTPLNNGAFAAYELGKLDEAERMLREAIPLAAATQPETRTIQGTLEMNLGRVLIDRGEYEEACALADGSLAKFTKILGEAHWRTAIARTVLGRCLAHRGSFGEAEGVLLEGYRVLDAERATGDTYRRDALEYLIELYELWGRPAEAAKYRAALETVIGDK